MENVPALGFHKSPIPESNDPEEDLATELDDVNAIVFGSVDVPASPFSSEHATKANAMAPHAK